MAWLLSACTLLLLYVFGGYPWLLRLIVAVRGPRVVRKEPITPSVTLIVSAFNERAVIDAKLRNSLALDYPADRLAIVVVSDASDDGTDEIVRGFAGARVRLFRQEARLGKTAGLNAVMPTIVSDVVVFSDANALYEVGALMALVRNFADPDVGCVTGEARYEHGNRSAADVGENVYWDYEMGVKRLETLVGSLVGGDGAIYAIRRHLWTPLPPNAINDFLNPLQIVAAGWRNVYEPQATAFEETAGNTLREYRRRVRIISRSWRAVFQAPSVLNPFQVGVFALCLVSHKVLRWFSPVLISLALVASIWLSAPVVLTFGRLPLLAGVAVLLLAAAFEAGRRVYSLLGYFCVLNAASLVGLVKGTFGNVSGTWAPPRIDEHHPASGWDFARRATGFVAVIGYLAIAVAVVQVAAARWHVVAMGAFWASGALLAYIYVGYPALIGVWRFVAADPPRPKTFTPTISVIIAANDEADVIAEKLENTLASDYPSDLLDVLVVSDGSVDGTDAIVGGFKARGVRLLGLPSRRGKISAVNAGVATCTSDILVLTDANAFMAPTALACLARNFADPRVGAASGDVVLTGERASLATSEDLYYGYERWLQQAESDVWSMIGVDGALYAVRRSLFVAQPPDTILDDMSIPMAAAAQGRRIVFEPEARAVEQGSFTAREEFARKTRVVAGAVQFLSRVPRWGDLRWSTRFALFSHKALRWLTPLFLILFYGSSASLIAYSPFRELFWMQSGAYLVGLLGCHPGLRRWPGVGLVHYFCLVQAGAAGGLLRGVLGRQRVTWERFGRRDDAHAASTGASHQ